MTFISKEIPTGVIDGVNTVFILLNDVDYIDDLWIDGAIYTDFTRIDKVLTLTDAPVVSIFSDYNTGTAQTSVETDCTYGDIKEKVWGLLGQKSTSINFSDTIVGLEINTISRQIWKGKVTNKLNPQQTFRAGDLYFRDQVTNIRIKGGSILTDIFNIGDIDADCDTANLLGAGYVEIGGDVINYTSTSTTQLLGTSGQTVDHLSQENVIQLYELPVNTDKPTKVKLIVQSAEARKYDIPLDNSDQYGRYYQIIRIADKVLLKIVGLSDGDLVKVKSSKKYIKMSSNTDKCPFPEDYGIIVIAYLVAGGLGYDKGIPNSQQHLNGGYTSLEVMYGDFNDEINIVTQRIQPKGYNFNTINRY